MPKLDGTAKHHEFFTPYDTHDRVVRDSSGYKHQEYPKAVDHEQKSDAPEGHFEPVIELQEYPKAVDHEQKSDAPEGHFEPVIELEP